MKFEIVASFLIDGVNKYLDKVRPDGLSLNDISKENEINGMGMTFSIWRIK